MERKSFLFSSGRSFFTLDNSRDKKSEHMQFVLSQTGNACYSIIRKHERRFGENMSSVKKMVTLILIIILTVCASTLSANGAAKTLKMPKIEKNTPLSKNGRLSVSRNKVVNSKGKTFVIKGVSTHGLSWYPEYVNKAGFKSLRDDFGVNTIRLAMYTAEYNGYCTGDLANRKQLKNLIDKGVKYATELGMYVIIDWHILSDGNPKTYQKQAISFFKEIATKYKKHTNVIYEICNEPNGNGSWSKIRSYGKAVIKQIRKIDKKAIIIVGTPTWSQDVDVASSNKITGYKNIAYGFHFYAGTHQQDMRNKLAAAVKGGLPVIVSEFGITAASGNGGVNTSQGNKWMTLLDKYSIGRVCWNLSNKNESSALISSSCSKTSNWKTANLTAQGKWLLKSYTGKSKTSNTPSSSGTSSSGATSSSGGESSSTSGTVSKRSISVKKVNSWKSGKKYYYLYTVTLKNKMGKASSGWTAKIKFNSKPKITEKWNGVYKVSSKTVTIKPVSYNKKIAARDTTELGFIVCSRKKLKVLSSSISIK